jgi:hypothetical protein
MGSEFVARRPRPGQYLVSLDTRRVSGRVVSIRSRDRRVRIERRNGERFYTWADWEELQYGPGRYRFVDVVPPTFTEKRKLEPSELCVDCRKPAEMVFHSFKLRRGWSAVPVCRHHWGLREEQRLAQFYAKHGGKR